MYSEKHKVKNSLWLVLFLILLALLVPIFAVMIPYRPGAENLASWFQRSGSVMTIISITIDVKLFSIYQWFHSSNSLSKKLEDFKERYYRNYKYMSLMALLLTVSGTLIWGYGDLIFIFMRNVFGQV